MKNTTSKMTVSTLVTSLFFQIICGILPGCLILIKQKQFSLTLVAPLLLYLALCEITQLINRNLYRKGKILPWPILAGKLLLSTLFILIFARQTSWWYGLILFAYEGMQLLQYSRSYMYNDTLYFTFMNAFFKGLVFNSLVSFKLPFQFKLTSFEPFIFAFLLMLLVTTFIQRNYSYLGRETRYTLLFLGSWLLLMVLILVETFQAKIGVIKALLLFVLNAFILYMLLSKDKNNVQKERLLHLVALANMLVYYL